MRLFGRQRASQLPVSLVTALSETNAAGDASGSWYLAKMTYLLAIRGSYPITRESRSNYLLRQHSWIAFARHRDLAAFVSPGRVTRAFHSTFWRFHCLLHALYRYRHNAYTLPEVARAAVSPIAN